MEKLTDKDKTNLATVLVYAGKKIPFLMEEHRKLAKKLGILDKFEFLEKRFNIEMPVIEKVVQAAKKNEN